MALKLLILSTFFYIALAHKYSCSPRSALHLLKRPAYEFSTRLLDRLAANSYSANSHFVFSPLSTWLQLTALAEGAEGRTFEELRHVTKHHKNSCFKLNLRRLLHKRTKELEEKYRSKSVIVIDKYMEVKKTYKNDVLKFFAVAVLLKDFDDPKTSMRAVNNLIAKSTNGVMDESILLDDFNDKTAMILSDNVYFKSAWKYPFDVAFTKKEPFRSSSGTYLGDVNMMSYTGYLNTADMGSLNARVLEIPCVSDFSMLILMPIRSNWIGDTFYNMIRTTLMSVFNRFKTEGEKLVHVKLPRFRMNSTVDNLPELLDDMGVKRIFNPDLADFSRISDYSLYVSLMSQIADIEVTEKGVKASASSISQINETAEKINFFADRPFAYMIVERKTQFILFAGTYSVPSVY